MSRAVFVFFVLVHIVFSVNSFVIKEDEPFLDNPFYHSQEDLEDQFARLAKRYTTNARVFTIGKSLEGRDLIALQISRNVRSRNILTPMVKYVGNMHGDETIGRQMLIYLADYLLGNYGRSTEVDALVNTTDIYIMPTMNPDGFFRSKEGSCDSLPKYVGRHNAAGVDLNRDFPDRFEDQRTIQYKARSRQPETAAMVNWISSNPFVLSANFHGGAVVASYPYDNSIEHHECCADSPTPDDRVFKNMAHTYANNHPVMRTGHDCNETFKDGITNGAYWYELNGGMQDFNYAFTNCFELTIELSCCKYPLASTLPEEWSRNKRSLIELLKLAHVGVKGLVQDNNGYPIREASIIVQGLEGKPIFTSDRGEYWRLLSPGTYYIRATAFGYESSPIETIEIKNEPKPLRLDFKLKPTEAIDDSFRKPVTEKTQKDSKGFLTPVKFEHHNFTQMEAVIRDLAASYPSITRMYSIGKSVRERDLWVLEIAQKPGVHTPGIPEFKYVANMHGNEVVGREMLLLLARMLCENYLLDDRITRIINTTRLHFLFSMNPDGYEISKLGEKTGAQGRGNIRGVDLNRNFPDQYGTNKFNMVMEPEVLAVMKWTLSIPFVLSANLHGGSLVANYPFDDSANDFNATGPVLRKNPTEETEMFEYLAQTYANAHTTMHFGKPCPLFPKEKFPGGVTNGAHWYSVTGGMQDWNYIRAGVFELTLELSCDKFPLAEELPEFWEQNREALLTYIEQIRHGVHGFVRSSIGTPVAGAMILLDDIKHATYSSTYGDYWKLVLPGKHNITVVADGFEPHRDEIEIPSTGDKSLRLDISLMRDDPQHWASAHDFRIIKNVVRTRYHSNDEIKNEMGELENKNVQIANFEFGDNEVSMEYHTLKVTSDIGSPEETKFHILILSSLFEATSPLGREITMNLARHFTEGHKIQEPPILRILNNTVLHFLPMMGGFDSVFSEFTQNSSVCDPVVSNDFVDRVMSPETEKKRDLFLKYLEAENFDMILSFSAGSSEVHFPASTDSNPIFLKLAQTIQKTEFNLSPIQCKSTSSRNHQKDSVQRITNLFYNMYHIPMFTLDISCCRMPPAKEIATVWRTHLEQIMNFVELTQTGIQGSIRDDAGNPLRSAYVQVVGNSKVYNVTKNQGHFHVALPVGTYAVEFACAGKGSRVLTLDVVKGVIKDLGSVVLSNVTELIGRSEVSLARIGGVSISGFVLDPFNHPVNNAKISIIKPAHSRIKNFTNSVGSYQLQNVPNGDVTLQVEAPGHVMETRLVHVGLFGENVRVVFHVAIDEQVMGVPRLFFILMMGCLLLVLLVCCTFCIQAIKSRADRSPKRNYMFSLLQQENKELFADDDDEEEDLFKSPLKKNVLSQPYYDDEREPIIDTDEEDDDASQDDLVMLRKGDC